MWDPAWLLLLSLEARHGIWALEHGLVHNSLVCFFKKTFALSCVSHTLLTQWNCLFFHLSSAFVLTKDF